MSGGSELQSARRKFLRLFPAAFRDETYLSWERDYKWKAHSQWIETLDRTSFDGLIREGEFREIARRAVNIESRTNLLFSFEKMALRDAVGSSAGARRFSEGLYSFLHSKGSPKRRFEKWGEVVAKLPRRQTRVLTWPIVTVFGFIAQPDKHIFLKPKAMKVAADKCGFPLHYTSRVSWETYKSLLSFAGKVRSDLRDLRPRDMIDIQSFLWVTGSDEYKQ